MFNFFKYSEAKLAEEIIGICSKLCPTQQFSYDAENGSVHSDSHDICLANLFDQVKDKKRQERLTFIEQFLQSAIGEMPIDYDSCSHLLMPRIKSTAELHTWSRYLSLSSHNQFQYRPITDNFVCMLGIDRTNTIHSVMSEDLEKMEMSFDEAFKHAMANLNRRSEAPFVEVEKGMYAADFQDGHNAARLMLTEQIANLKVNGLPVAFLPTNDELVICGTKDVSQHAQLAKQCQELVKHAKPLSFDTLVLVNGQWQDYYPDKTPAYAPIYNLHKIERATQYFDQQRQMEQQEQHNATLILSPQMIYEREDSPFYFSVCQWSEQGNCLLPISDQVHFVADIDGKNQTGVIAVLSWQDTIEHFGNLMTPQQMIPERFLVRTFPSKEQLLKVVASNQAL